MTPIKIVDVLIKPFIESSAKQIKRGISSIDRATFGELTPDLYYRSFESILIKAEGVLTLTGFIPEVSFYTGGFRCVVGLAQTISFSVLAAFRWIKSLFVDATTLEKEFLKYEIGFLQHGIGNIARGVVEMIPQYGNWISMGYSLSGERLKYESELESDRREEYKKARAG